MKNAIDTKHNLDFEAAPWDKGIGKGIMAYRIGTCHGIYQFTDQGIEIISINNELPGNGHLDDVFQWFEYAAQVQKLRLWIRAFMNREFKTHCINKRGFIQAKEPDDVYKDLK